MTKSTIAVIGGTGAEGSGLALRWAAAGYSVILGSRSAEKAQASAIELSVLLPDGSASLTGATNADAAAAAEIVVLSVPYDAQVGTIDQIKAGSQGKTFITVTVPLKPPKVATVWHPAGGLAAQEAQIQLGEQVNVVAAFQNISAGHLKDLNWQADCDVFGRRGSQRGKTNDVGLGKAVGLYGIDAGPLANVAVVEGLTALLIGINMRNKVQGSGIRITGIPRNS